MKTLVPPGRRTLRSWISMFDWITGLLSVLGLFGGFLLTLAEKCLPSHPFRGRSAAPRVCRPCRAMALFSLSSSPAPPVLEQVQCSGTVSGVRTLISAPAGETGMTLASFLVCTTIGSALWTTSSW